MTLRTGVCLRMTWRRAIKVTATVGAGVVVAPRVGVARVTLRTVISWTLLEMLVVFLPFMGSPGIC